MRGAGRVRSGEGGDGGGSLCEEAVGCSEDAVVIDGGDVGAG